MTPDPLSSAPVSAAELLTSGVSVRRFTADEVADSIVEDAVAVAQRAPSASGHQPYSVAFVTDPALRAQLESVMVVQEFVRAAPVFLVVYVDWSRQDVIADELIGSNSMNRTSRLMVGTIDASIFAHHLALALQAAGLGVCMVANPLLAMDEVARILKLPTSSCMPLHVLVAGHPDEEVPPRPRYPREMVLHRDSRPGPPDVDATMSYLRRGDAQLQAVNYFEVTGDPITSWPEHYAIKYGRRAAERTWEPLAHALPGFLDGAQL